jgi:hypothetical protein
MKDEGFMDRYDDDDDDDDDSFIPESLRGFLQAADEKLQGELDEVMKSAEPSTKPRDDSHWNEDHDDDDVDCGNLIFFDSIEKEANEAIRDHLDQPNPMDSNISPNMIVVEEEEEEEEGLDHTNLTLFQAQQMAMDGGSPVPVKRGGRDLQQAFLEASATPEKQQQPETETSYISSDSEGAEPQPISPPAIYKTMDDTTTPAIADSQAALQPTPQTTKQTVADPESSIHDLEQLLESRKITSTERKRLKKKLKKKKQKERKKVNQEQPDEDADSAVAIKGIELPGNQEPTPQPRQQLPKSQEGKPPTPKERVKPTRRIIPAEKDFKDPTFQVTKMHPIQMESILAKELEKQKAINVKLTPPRTQTQQPEKLEPKPSATPPRPQPTTLESESPPGMVSNLLDYLIPSCSNPAPPDRQQLFTNAVPSPTKAPSSPAVIMTKNAKPQTTKNTIASSPQRHNEVSRLTAPSPMSSMASPSTASRSRQHQGQSPIVSPPPHRKELTSADKNIPSRLLRGTSASRARKPKGSTKSTRAQPRPGAPSSRLIRTTQSSRIQPKTTEPAPASKKTPSLRVATSIISRFMQPTKASRIKSPTVQAELEAKAATKRKEQERQATKARFRARIEHQKKRSDRQEERKREKKQMVKSTLDKVRERRERLQQMERARVAKLKEKIAERDKKAKERLLKLQAKASPRSPTKETKPSNRRPPSRPRPTIPVTPNFPTNKRLKRRSSIPQKEENIPIAASNDVLMRSFREDLSVGGDSNASGNHKLTIPEGPKLATAQKYGEKGSSNSVAESDHHQGDDDSVHAWQSGLRSVTSPPHSTSGEPRKLTIPMTPNFQPSRQRELPKSTTQRENEEMDYFQTHSFKATPIEMDKRSTSRPKAVKARKLTTPKPFNLSTNRRRSSSQTNLMTEDHKTFKARPGPTFPASKGTPVTGFTMRAKQTLTTPKPFKLSTSRRATSSRRSGSNNQASGNHGPPKSITVHDNRRFSQEYTKEEEVSVKQFQARPMPNFGIVKVPVTAGNPTKPRPSPRAENKEESFLQFRAKPVPKSLSKPFTPVKERDPTKLKSPDYAKESSRIVSSQTSSKSRSQLSSGGNQSPPFRAKPMPDLSSSPRIPVRDKDPSKLRNSPTKFLSPNRTGFIARPAPARSPPEIPVRAQDPSKLRSPSWNSESTINPNLPAPPSLAGSSQATPCSSFDMEKRIDKKVAVREMVRRRMIEKAASNWPKNESFVTETSSSTSTSIGSLSTVSSSIRSRLKSEISEQEANINLATQKLQKLEEEEEEAPTTTLFCSAMDKWPTAPASDSKEETTITASNVITATNAVMEEEATTTAVPPLDASLLHAAMKQWPVTASKDEAKNNITGKEEEGASTPKAKGNNHLNKAELQSAMDGWLFSSSLNKTPRTANARFMKPVDDEATKLAKQKQQEQDGKGSRSQLFQETTLLAAQLQRAVEDELSFEASMNCKDLDEGYIGKPTIYGDKFSL